MNTLNQHCVHVVPRSKPKDTKQAIFFSFTPVIPLQTKASTPNNGIQFPPPMKWTIRTKSLMPSLQYLLFYRNTYVKVNSYWQKKWNRMQREKKAHNAYVNHIFFVCCYRTKITSIFFPGIFQKVNGIMR